MGQHRSCSLLSNLSQKVIDTEYAHRAATILQAQEAVAQHPTGQRVDRFDEQVLSCLFEPTLLAGGTSAFSETVCDRAQRYLEAMSAADYSALGASMFRQAFAQFLTDRDAGLPADPDDVLLFDGGASAALESLLRTVLASENDAVLLPLPQYPLWSSTSRKLGKLSAGYYLDEENSWGTNMSEISKSVQQLHDSQGRAGALVVINPGNPAGQILSRSEMEAILAFAEQEKLVVLADEAQQGCLHLDNSQWLSFRQVASEQHSGAEVVSIHVAGPGAWGVEGAAVHCHNVSESTVKKLKEDALGSEQSQGRAKLGLGHALMATVVTPPPGDSMAAGQRIAERQRLASGFHRKAKTAQERFAAVDGCTCVVPQAGPFIFPRVIVKGYVMKKAISYATPADQIYCMELAEREGVAVMPGCGLGQRPGHFHFRFSLNQSEAAMMATLSTFERFHKEHPGGWFE